MTKSGTITVTVAPNCHVTLPHQSGIKELPGALKSGGDTVSVDPATAADLWRAGLILHPETGAKPIAPVLDYAEYLRRAALANSSRPKDGGVRISAGPGSAPLIGMTEVGLNLNWAAYAEPPSSRDRAPTPPPHSCAGPVLTMTKEAGEW